MVLNLDSIVTVCNENNNDGNADIFFNFVPIKELKLRRSNTFCGNIASNFIGSFFIFTALNCFIRCNWNRVKH